MVRTAHKGTKPVNVEAIEAEILRIRSLNKGELRSLWRDTFNRDVPPALTKDLIARMIIFRIQEEAYGGFDRAMLKILDSYAKGRGRDVEMFRRLKPGTEVIREYKGERHTVTVTADGYFWRGNTYRSLSSIARLITGTSWNGPRFFGLRERAEGNAPEAEPRKR